MVSKDFPAFSTLSLSSEVIVGLRIFTSNEIGSPHVRKKLDRKRITLVVRGGGEFKKMMIGYIAIPQGRKPITVFDFRIPRM